MIHPNSIKAIKQLKKGGIHNRILQIHHIMGRPLTDREVKVIGKFDDMNAVRPRITELCSEFYGKRLEECGTVTDIKTRKKVRQSRLVKQRAFFSGISKENQW